MARPDRRELILAEAKALSPSVRELVFRTVDGEPFEYVAGQWVSLYVPAGDGELVRSYSIAAAPDPALPSRVEVAVTLVDGGPVSGALHAMPLGTRIDAKGPLGMFTLDGIPTGAPVIFVGTGTGVAPLRAMLLAKLSRSANDGGALTLLFGCRTVADLLYRAEFETLAGTHGRFCYAPTLSRPDGHWSGRTGYVQSHLRECGHHDAHVFVCGLSKMVKDVRRVLKENFGYDRKRIHSERYD